MLGKLIKYEWKNTYRMGCLMLGAVAFITIFGWLSFQTPMWRALDRGSFTFSWLDMFSLFTLVMYAMLLAGASLGILIYLGVHFYKTMYTDEGYLTHTLPVTKLQLLGSKVLVSGLWMLFVELAIYLSIFLLGTIMLSTLLPEDYTLASYWSVIVDGLGDLLFRMETDFTLDIMHWLAALFVTALVGPFTTVTILFGAISLGQLSGKHRVFMAILCYIGIMVARSLISSVLRSLFTLVERSVGSYMNANADFGVFVDVLLAVGLFAASYYVTEKRLNME